MFRGFLKNSPLSTIGYLGTLCLILGLPVASYAAPPTFSKAFSPSSIFPSQVSTLTFTIDNSGQGTIFGLVFTDTLPGDLVITTPSVIDNNCGGVLTATEGTSGIGYTRPSSFAAVSCTISIDVTSSTVGQHNNISSDLTSSAGNSGSASASLTVNPLPTFSRAYSPSPIFVDQTSTLTYTVDNSGSTQGITGIQFSDNLASDLVIESQNGNTCGDTLTAVPGTSSISYSGGSVVASGTCTISVDVTSSVPQIYANSSEDLTSSAGNSGNAFAFLTVEALPGISIDYNPNPVFVGQTSTLTYTLDNPSGSQQITDVAFFDLLPVATTIASLTGNTCGDTLTADLGAGWVIFANGIVDPASGCTISVDVVSTTAGSKENDTDDMTSSAGNSGGAAIVIFDVEPLPVFSKAFIPADIFEGEISTLTYTVNNNGASQQIDDVAFSDSLPTDLVIATPNGQSSTCGGTLTAVAGNGTISLSGANTNGPGSCTVSVNVTSSVVGGYPSTSEDLTSTAGNSGTAMDTLTVNSPPTFSKLFSPDVIAAGGISSLSFTVDNSASTADLTDIAFADFMPLSILQVLDEYGAGGKALDRPRDVAIDSTGNLFVSGQFSDNVFKITPSGNISEIIDANGDGNGNTLDGPRGVAVDSTGNVYVAGGGSDNVFKITPGGTITEIIDSTGDGTNDLDSPAGLTVDLIGRVYVAGLASDNVFRIAPGGFVFELLDATGAGTASTALEGPIAIAVDDSLIVYVAAQDSDNVFKYSSGLVTEVMDEFSHDLDRPQGIAVDADGNAYVVGMFSDNVFKITSGGVITKIMDASGDGVGNNLSQPVGVATDDEGYVYVTGSSSRNVFQVTTTGHIQEILNSTGDGSGNTLGAPHSVIADSGNVYVPGWTSDNVFRITPAITIATPKNDSDSCGGTLIAEEGSGVITYSGGTVGAGLSCTVSLDVTSSLGGTHVNISEDLISSAGNSSDATDTLTVNQPLPTFSKEFIPDPIFQGGASTLTFTIDNSASAVAITHVAFDDILNRPEEILDTTGNGTKIFDRPYGIAVDSGGSVYVAGLESDNVFKITLSGTITEIIDATGDGINSFTEPTAVAVDMAGNVFVPGRASDNVFKVTPGGSISVVLDSSSGVSEPLKPAVDAAGNLYVTGFVSDNVYKVTPGGAITEIIDATGDPNPAHILDGPYGLAVDTAGNVYVSGFYSDNVFKITPGGSITEIIDSTGDGAGNDFDSPLDLAVDGTGNVFVAGRNSDNAFEITPGGIITEIIDSAGDGAGNPLDAPQGVAIDGDGNIYVAGRFSDNLFQITPTGVVTAVLDSDGDGGGNPLDYATSVTAASGHVYVAGANSDNVFRVTPTDVVLATANSAVNGCGGTLAAVEGTGAVTYYGGTVADGVSCTISVDVVGTAVGSHLNTTGDLTSSAGNSGTTQDTLTVQQILPTFTKVFGPDLVFADQASTLTFTIDNLASPSSLTSLDFTDTLPSNLVIADPSGATNGCDGGSLTAVPGGSVISYSLGSLTAESSCAISVDVTSSLAGVYENTSGPLTSSAGTSGTASDSLTVEALPGFSKVFSPDFVYENQPSTLTFTIDNSATVVISGVGFTDTLPTDLVIATPNGMVNGCTGDLTATAASDTITYSNGLMAAGANCTLSVQVVSSIAGSYDNTSDPLTSSAGNSGSATDTLTVEALPTFAKAFNPGTILAGETSTLTFTVDNNASATDLTDVAFDDFFPRSGIEVIDSASGLDLPIHVVVDAAGNLYVPGRSSHNAFKIEPDGTTTEIIDSTGDGSGNTLAGPEGIAVDATGNVFVTGRSSHNAFKITPGGVITQIITSAGDGGTNPLSTPTAIAVDGVGNVFVAGRDSDNVFKITPGGSVSEIIDNAGVGGNLTNPEGLAVDGSGNVYVTSLASARAFKITPGGTITTIIDNTGDGNGHVAFNPRQVTVDGSGNVFLVGASSHNAFKITSGGTVTQIIDETGDGQGNALQFPRGIVVDSTGNVYVSGWGSDNVFQIAPSGAIRQVLSSTGDGAGNLLDAPQRLAAGPGGVYVTGGDSDNVFRIPPLMEVATPANINDGCGGSLSTSGSNIITYSGGMVTAGTSCTVSVDVTASITGSHLNQSEDLTWAIGSVGGASGTLVVNGLPGFSKGFNPDTIFAGQISTLTFTVDNLESSNGITDVAFSDPLPSNLVIATPNGEVDGCGGSLTAVAGTDAISYSGGSTAAGASCNVTVNVTSSVPGEHMNTSGDMTSSAGNSGFATDTLRVNPLPAFSKAFSPNAILAGGTSTLTFTVDNSSSNTGISAITFTDLFPGGLVVASPTGASSNCSGGSLTAIAGVGIVSHANGMVAAGASCTISVNVTSLVVGAHVNTTGDLTTSAGNSGTATDTLTVEAPPLFTKVFSPDSIALGGTSTLTFTVDNSASTVGLTNLAFDDFLPTLGGVISEVVDAAATGGTLDRPSGVAVDQAGNVYVVGFASDNAFKITPGGAVSEVIDASGDGAAILDGPRGIGVDGSGNVYVIGQISDNAFKITPGGTISEIIDATGDGAGKILDAPHGIAVDAAGNVYVTGYSTDNAFWVTPGGSVSEIIDATGDGAGKTLESAHRIAVANDGTVYVTGASSNNVFEISAGGTIIERIDASGDGAGAILTRPNGVTVDGSGNIYVLGQISNNAFKITPSGTITEIIYSGGDQAGNGLDSPFDVAVDHAGNAYVTGFSSDNVFQITPAGLVTEVFDSAGDNIGGPLDGPRHVAVGPGGVYVAGYLSDNALQLAFPVVIATPTGAVDGCGGDLTDPEGGSFVTYSGGSLSFGESCSVSVNVVGTAPGLHVNTSGELTSSAGNSGSATDSLTVEPQVELTLSKAESADPVTAGSGMNNLVYTITVGNLGPSSATGLALSEALTVPAGVLIESIVPSGSTTYPEGSTDGTWTVGTLAPGASETLTVTLTVGASALPGTDVISDVVTVTQINEANVGAMSVSESTSVATLADLMISKADSQDPVAAGNPLTYTISVLNSLGPSDATNVLVTETLPAGVTFVQTIGCDNDPVGVPVCSLGTISAGAMKQYTVEVGVDVGSTGVLTNQVLVASDTPEAIPGDNDTSESTTIDAVLPTVTLVDSMADTGDGELAECEEARVDLTQLMVHFSEAVQDPVGDTSAIDVTNPGSYLLVSSGSDQDFATVSCADVAGDDEAVVIDTVVYSEPAATLSINGGLPLGDSLYRLLVCSASVRDLNGNLLDGNGDGTSGDDFVRTYRVEQTNIFLNGDFDCALDSWVSVPPFSYSTTDLAGSGVSGSAGFATPSDTGAALGQCSPASPGPYQLNGWHSVISPNPDLSLRMICEYFSDPGCSGTSLGIDEVQPEFDLTGIWESTMLSSTAPPGSQSALCSADLLSAAPSEFDVLFDGMLLRAVLFADGFETGDTSVWTGVVP